MLDNIEINLFFCFKVDDWMVLQYFFEDYYEMVCQLIYCFVFDVSIVEDLVQEVFFWFWEKCYKIEINFFFGVYICCMAINEGLGYLCCNKCWEQEVFELGYEFGVDDSVEDKFFYGEMQENVIVVINQLFFKC